MSEQLRVATAADIPAIQRIRRSVRENRLISGVISDDDVRMAITVQGRGWVVDVDAAPVGFAIGNDQTGNIWALFVDPSYERRGYGRRLHDVMVAWLWSRGLPRLWLTTDPDTRAERFYRAAGWRYAGCAEHGEVRFELDRPSDR